MGSGQILDFIDSILLSRIVEKSLPMVLLTATAR